MIQKFRSISFIKHFAKTMTFSRLRRLLPIKDHHYVDDRDRMEEAEFVRIDWPEEVQKPKVGIVKDFQSIPRWTKYCRVLDMNGFPYGIFNIHNHDWIEQAKEFDVIVGIVSGEKYYLEEMQKKYMFLESYLGKKCFPSYAHALLYESKSLEAFISQAKGIPYAKTHISYNKEDAKELINHLEYPFISKVDPSSGSMGVELVQSYKQARRIVEEAFSPNGRKIHVHYFRQKNHVYFQEFIPNDGYDIRVIIVGDWAFGYYRKVLEGDFRASGMDLIENKELPEEAVLTAWNANKHIQSPLLVVDMVHGLDGKYSIIEFSPTCKIGSSDRFFVNGVPCYYSIDSEGAVHLEKGFYWVHELALREFLLKHCLSYSS